jgi:hypothetical protein
MVTLLEFAAENSHSISQSKAQRLVTELGIAKFIGHRTIQLTVAHSWSVVKSWLQISQQERELRARRETAVLDYKNQLTARKAFPNGAQYGFNRWPSRDLRS